ncbi:terminase small subunit [Desulfarculus baarsii]
MSIVNRTQLAEIFGVSLPTVDAWRRDGCPVEKQGGRGKEYKFDTVSVLEWRQEREARRYVGNTEGITEDEARARKLAAEAALAEITLAERLNAVALTEDVFNIVSAEYAAVRTQILAIPTKTAPLCFAASSIAEVQQIIDKEIRQALAELSYADIADDEPESVVVGASAGDDAGLATPA